jgi:hypothetical protein
VWCRFGVGYLPHLTPQLRRRRQRKRRWIEPTDISDCCGTRSAARAGGSHAPRSFGNCEAISGLGLLANYGAGSVRSTEEFCRRSTVGTDRRSPQKTSNSAQQLKLLFGKARRATSHFSTWTNERFIGSVGIVLKDGPERSCCWSSTLFSQEAKLTLNDAIAE